MLEVIRDLVSTVLIMGGGLMVALGLFGVLRFKDFTLKLLAGAKTDTVGFVAIVLGLAVRSGLTWFTAKALLILVIVLLAGPITTSAIAAGHAAQQRRAGRGE